MPSTLLLQKPSFELIQSFIEFGQQMSEKSLREKESFLDNILIYLQKNSLIEDFDILIASRALTNNLILATTSTKHFERIDRIKLED